MKKPLMGAVIALTLAFGAAAAQAATIDLDSGDPFPPALSGGDRVIATTGVANTRLPATLSLPAGDVTFGGAGQSFSAATDAILMGGSPGDETRLFLEAAANGGVKLTAGTLVLAGTGGGMAVTIDASAAANANALTIAELRNSAAQGDATLTVNANSRLTVMGVDNANTLGGGASASAVTLALNGGHAVFANDLTLAKGAITAAGGLASTLAVGGAGLALTGGTATVLSASGAGASLDILAAGHAGRYADVALAGTLDLRGGAAVALGSLAVNAGAAFSAMSDSGTLTIHGDLGINSDFTDREFVAANVLGATAVAAGATYAVSGRQNIYQGAMTLAGILRYDAGGSGVIRLGRHEGGLSVAPGRMVIDGGGVAVANAGAFAVNTADILVARANALGDTVAVAAGATLDLSQSDLTIDAPPPAAGGGIVAMTTGRGIAVRGFALRSGSASVTQNDPGGRLAARLPAVIGGGGAEAALDLAGDAALFARGLTLDRRGALTVRSAVTGVVTLGAADHAASLALNGDALLHAGTGNALRIASGHADAARLAAQGRNNAAIGEIDAASFAAAIGVAGSLTVATDAAPATAAGLRLASLDVAGELTLGDRAVPGGDSRAGVVGVAGGIRVLDGGVVRAVHRPASLRGNAGNALGEETFTVSRGGSLIADTAGIAATGFASVDIDGVFTAGVATGGGTAARLLADSGVSLGANGVIALTPALAATAVADADASVATRLIETTPGHVIANQAALSSRSMLGDFGFALNGAGNVLHIASAANRVWLNGGQEDRAQARRNLAALWGDGQVADDLAAGIYDVVRGDAVSDATPAGDKNAALLAALANPAGNAVGRDTLAYANGAHLFGVVDAALDVGRFFTAGMTGRAREALREFAARPDGMASGDALGTAALPGAAVNGVWFGGAGHWSRADARDGFPGYSHDGRGIVGGYDRAVAERLALGASLSYLKGDYRDNGALASDSRIESYSAGLYGAWSGLGGAFTTLYGAFTRSSAALRDLRNDPHANRSVWSAADVDTDAWSLGGLAGYDFRLAENVTVTPAAGIDYVSAGSGDHESTLDGVATQSVSGMAMRGVYVPVEVSARYEARVGRGGRLRVEGVAGYAYNLDDGGMKGTIRYLGLSPAGGARIHGRDVSRHKCRLGAGIGYAQSNFEIRVQYDYAGGSQSGTHRAAASVGFRF